MKKQSYNLQSKVFLYPGMSGWHFIGVDKKTATKIKEKYGGNKRGFGSIRVSVTIGSTTWDTSIFPDKRTRTYVLPIKAKIRKNEGIYDGDTVRFSITIV